MLPEFHRDLLADTIRTNAYRSAIRSVVTRDSVVLDLGTGTGILAFFACEAGARRVFAIEEGDAGVTSMLARHLGLSDRVEIIHARSTQVELPERAHVLVTETLGPFGLDEHILSSVMDARARLLMPGATIIPRHLALCLAPVVCQAQTVTARQIAAVRTMTPMTVDGALDEAAWRQGEAADGFIQSEPATGQAATERTTVRIVFDGVTLFIGATCYDRDPAGIIVNDLRKDFALTGQDTFEVVLDSFGDRRNGFLFATNAAGARAFIQFVTSADGAAVWSRNGLETLPGAP